MPPLQTPGTAYTNRGDGRRVCRSTGRMYAARKPCSVGRSRFAGCLFRMVGRAISPAAHYKNYFLKNRRCGGVKTLPYKPAVTVGFSPPP